MGHGRERECAIRPGSAMPQPTMAAIRARAQTSPRRRRASGARQAQRWRRGERGWR